MRLQALPLHVAIAQGDLVHGDVLGHLPPVAPQGGGGRPVGRTTCPRDVRGRVVTGVVQSHGAAS